MEIQNTGGKSRNSRNVNIIYERTTRNNVIKYCTSTAFFEVKSLDASNNFIDKLYNKAIITSINECFIKLAD